MDRERARTALTILLAVVVVGTAAAGLVDSTSPGGESRPGIGTGEGSGVGSGNGSDVGFNVTAPNLSLPAAIIEVVIGGIVSVSLVAGTVYVGVLVVERRLGQLPRAVIDAVGAVLLVIGILVLAYLIGQFLGTGGGGTLGSAAQTVSGSGGGESGPLFDPSALSPVAIGVAVLAAVALLALLSRDDEETTTPEPPGVDVDPTTPPPRPRQYRYHGRAVDAPATNEVYVAWDRLASEVGATGSTTPAEVSRDAVDSGYDPDAVAELTALFREVRYGDERVDPDRAHRARELTDRLWRTDVEPT